MQKMLSLIITLCVISGVLTTVPLTVSATTSGTCGDNLTWVLDKDGTLTISGIGDMYDYSDYQSTIVPWYSNRSNIKSIIINNGVVSIGADAFSYCTELTTIAIPDSVANIEISAFEGCISLTNITLPNSITNIGGDAFSGCTGLESITIPDSVTSIGGGAFSRCGLTSITISDSVTNIGNSAFYMCDNLTKVYISDIEAWCNIDFENSGSNPLAWGANLYLNDILVENLEIPSTITEIKPYAFFDCKSIKSITLPDSITNIGIDSFSGCTGLLSLTIPDNVTNIGDYAFQGCTELTRITISDSVTNIGYNAFNYCYNLENVYISDIEAWCNIDFENPFSNPLCCGANLYLTSILLESLEIPISITEIKSYTFYSCKSLISITIPKSVIYIGYNAFSDCNNLSDVYYMGSVEDWNKINKSYAVEFEQIHFAEVTETYIIKYDANSGSGAPETQSKNKGESIILSTSEPIREGYSFLGWATTFDAKEPEYFSGAWFDIDSDTVLYAVWKDINDTTIASGVCGDLTWALDEEGILVISGSGNMGNYSYYPTTAPWYSNRFSIKSIIIDNGVKSIGDYAFYGCGNLTSVTIPDNVVKIGDYAFCCSSLSDIYITDNTYKIAHTAFDGTKWYDSQPDGVVYLGKYVYSYKGEMPVDTSIVLNNAIGIADYAFSDCENLSELTIGENVKYIGSYAFKNCVNLKTVKYNAINCYYSDGGYSVEETEQFSGCDGLEDIVIGNKVIFIPTNMFSNCTNIKKVYIGDSVEVIGGAFTNCTQIKEFNIPKSVKYIWQYAFPVTSELENIYYEGTEEDWNNILIYYSVPAAWTINTNTCLQTATKHYNCVLEKEIEVISNKYNGKLEIKFSMDNSECDFKVVSLTDDFDTGEIKLFVTCYGENGQFTGFEECKTTDKEDSRIYNFSLPTSKYKIMLWDNNCCPLINAIE